MYFVRSGLVNMKSRDGISRPGVWDPIRQHKVDLRQVALAIEVCHRDTVSLNGRSTRRKTLSRDSEAIVPFRVASVQPSLSPDLGQSADRNE
jgi:hypothetical protein